MRLWWVSMSLFMELEGELGLVLFSCCSSNGIPHQTMYQSYESHLFILKNDLSHAST